MESHVSSYQNPRRTLHLFGTSTLSRAVVLRLTYIPLLA